jgi:restriction endonuclease Mrr
LPRKLSEDELDNYCRRIVAIHGEQRPRGDQLEVPDELLLHQMWGRDRLEMLQLIKKSLLANPRLISGRWISYDPTITCFTIESIPTPERLEWLVEKMKLNLASRLESKIREQSPNGFEQFVKDFVESTKGISVQRTGKSHDGGVDFIGEKKAEDELSLPMLLVGQAKRWKKPATREDVAAFIGDVDMRPLPKRHANKLGIYISCSGFTDDAVKNAPRATLRLTLWNVNDIASMMLTRSHFGIKKVRIEVPAWDESFWNDYK